MVITRKRLREEGLNRTVSKSNETESESDIASISNGHDIAGLRVRVRQAVGVTDECGSETGDVGKKTYTRGELPQLVAATVKPTGPEGENPVVTDLQKLEETTPKCTPERQRATGLTDYERLREENMRANAIFLASLNITEDKENVRKMMMESKPKNATKHGIKQSHSDAFTRKEPINLRPRRQALPVQADVSTEPKTSRRRVTYNTVSLKNLPQLPDNDELGGEEQDVILSVENLTFQAVMKNSESAGQLNLDGLLPADDKRDEPPLPDFLSLYKNTCMTESTVCKVTPHRVFSLAWHPADSPLLAAGDKWGHIGLWDMTRRNDSSVDHGVHLFAPHTRPVNCLEFSSHDPYRLYSVSYDGTVRLCDLNKQHFLRVYHSDTSLTYLAIQPQNLTIAQTDGCIINLDLRSKSHRHFSLLSGRGCKIRGISYHPMQINYFITAAVRGTVELWDARTLTTSRNNKPLCSLFCKKSVTSAYFSPVTGDKIVTCSMDDLLRVYDSSNLSEITQQSSISHNNWTTRWLTPFRCSWHPRREDCFIIGSMKHPRQVEMFGTDGSILHTFQDADHLQSVMSLTSMHPTQVRLAGVNSSGRVHVFM